MPYDAKYLLLVSVPMRFYGVFFSAGESDTPQTQARTSPDHCDSDAIRLRIPHMLSTRSTGS